MVKAGSSSTVSVSAKPAEGTAAGTYPITVDATSGSRTAHADLSVEITGSYKLALSTADQRLNMSAHGRLGERHDADPHEQRARPTSRAPP